MSVSILEALQNAQYNLSSPLGNSSPIKALAMAQLGNAIALLEKGYDPYEQVEPLLEKYGSAEAVPEKAA